jgi:tripartite-type tricarboxylate transporter receptor subunit TctC
MTGALLRGRLAVAMSVAVIAACGGSAFAQTNYPLKPIRLIVPFPPGGSTTIVARLYSQKLIEAWGQQVIVDNRGGGNTIIGSELLVRAAPDAYTWLHVTSTHVINPSLLKTPYDAVRDFAPVATVVATETLLVINNNVPAKTLQELISLAKSKPGELNFASSGSGTSNHLAMEFFCILAGVKMQHIPHKGAGPAITDLVGGGVQAFTNNALPLTPFVKSGRMRAIAISGDKRLKSLPDVPTFAEAGMTNFQGRSWQGIMMPAKTPAELINKASSEMARILKLPDVGDKLVTMGADPFYGTPAEFAALLKADLPRYAKLIKQANIRLN